MTNKPTWETRFHDKFTYVMGKGSIYGEERFLSTDDPRDIENFIDDLLAEQKQQLIEKIDNFNPEYGELGGVLPDFKERLINLIKQD